MELIEELNIRAKMSKRASYEFWVPFGVHVVKLSDPPSILIAQSMKTSYVIIIMVDS
jgi:hypothetical protein